MRDLPPAAQAVLRRSLAKLPAERYATCGDMLDALENALLRPAVAPTRVADAPQFIPPTPAALAQPVDGARAHESWAARNLSGEALKYFGVTFVVCALILAAVFHFLLPGKVTPRAVPAAPAVAPVQVPAVAPAAAPAVSEPATPAPSEPAAVDQPAVAQEPAAPEPARKAKGSRGRGAKKRAEPEVEFKPVEPKIIRQ
jgi:hypothetical protein